MLRLFLLLAFASGFALPVLAQPTTATLSGTVTDRDGQPLPGANVFIADSQRGTVTDTQGRFRLGGVPLGVHRLVASIIGYETQGEDLVLRDAGATRTVDFRLKEAEFELGEVTVEGEQDEAWQRRYERFKHRFLGESANAAQTTIENPFVLDFEEKLGELTATAREPLVIENRALGYRIRYDLTAFEARSNSNFFDGEALFEELEPSDPGEYAEWQANRRKAYLGSGRHLVRSLITGTAEEEGYKLFLLPPQGPGGFGSRRQNTRFPTTASDILKPARDEGDWLLTYFGVLQSIYTREAEEAGYVDREWSREQRPAREVQTSELRFPIAEDKAQLDRFGEELDPRSIVVSGYMAFERFAEQLPREYGLAESGIPGAAEAVEASLSEAER